MKENLFRFKEGNMKKFIIAICLLGMSSIDFIGISTPLNLGQVQNQMNIFPSLELKWFV